MAEEKNQKTKSDFEWYQEFQNNFPIDELQNMNLKTYTDIDTAKGFSFWIINKRFGNTNYKSYMINLGIYKYTDKAKFGNIKNTPRGSDYTYAWQYDTDRDMAFTLIKHRIFDIATNAKNYSQNQDKQYLKNIDKIELPPVYKWKIAFLYSGSKLIDCYSVDKLKELFQKLLPKEKIPRTISDLQYQLVKIKNEKPDEFEKKFATLWLPKNKNNKNNNEDKTMTDTNNNASVLAKNLAKLLKNTKNIILHGAPGTGKTYLAKDIAAYMNFDKLHSELNDEEEKKFSEHTCFVQFHPSYDYTDFVEGIRPTPEEKFKLEDGIFKKFCKKALKKTNIDNFTSVWNQLVETLKDKKIINIPFLSKVGTFEIELNNDGSGLRSPREKWTSFLNWEHLYNVYKGLPGMPKAGQDNYMKAILNYMKDNMGLLEYKEEQPFIFIIDEINRGELSKIFGELFFAIDPSYRGENGRVSTQYQNLIKDGDVFYNGFFVPDNVYIIGTMNDIDRSVESMDFAMRRRFTFKEITAKDSEEMLTEKNLKGVETKVVEQLKKRMSNLNDTIISNEIGLSSGYQIGAAYFLKYAQYKDESDPFNCLWKYNLEPLLQEYLRGQDPTGKKLGKLKAAYNKSEDNQTDQTNS